MFILRLPLASRRRFYRKEPNMKITQIEINEIIADFYQLNKDAPNKFNTYEACSDHVMAIMHEVGMLDEGYELSWSQDTFADAFNEVAEEYRLGELERHYERRYFR